MRHLIGKYVGKLAAQGLADPDRTVLLALDADLFANRPVEGEAAAAAAVLNRMNISSLLVAEPCEPYRTILRELTNESRGMFSRETAETGLGSITPMDCETRTFFHDIPVLPDFAVDRVAAALALRKSAVVRNGRIVTYGVVTPEQAFVSFSSACFSTFVTYFHDCLRHFERCQSSGERPEADFLAAFDRVCSGLREDTGKGVATLARGAPGDEETVLRMLAQAGRALVGQGLVDSHFGNISYIYNGALFISQTGSSLDELDTCIDRVPLDGTSSAGITASSELSAHKSIYRETGLTAILHGHPKFSVIMSLDCPHKACRRTDCHKACPETRSVAGVPVVPGEIGRGPTSLMHTVPAAMKQGRAAIVHGHGVFAGGQEDFQEPFDRLVEIERKCRREYFQRVGRCR